MAIVYIHRRLDIKDEFKNVFYVGVGKTEKRAKEIKHSRNSHWKSIYNKCEISITITHKDLCHEEAHSIEKYLISFYGRKDLKLGNLCNHTDGGDGVLNWSEKMKKNHSIVQKKVNGTKDAIELNRQRTLLLLQDETYRKKIQDGLKRVLGTEEQRRKNSKRRKDFFQKEENKINHKKLMKEIHGTTEQKNKNRINRTLYWENKRDLPTGVYVHGKGYKSKISKDGNSIFLCYSKSIDDCSKAYQKALENINNKEFWILLDKRKRRNHG
jgi:hypothetical protein